MEVDDITEGEILLKRVSCPCDSDVKFSECKVVILKELLDECRQDIGQLTEQFQELCGEKTEIHRLLQDHQQQQASLQQQNDGLQSQLRTMADKIHSSEEDQKSLQEQVKTLTSDLEAITTSNEELTAHVNTWDEQISIFKEFLQEVKSLASLSPGEVDDNNNLVFTNRRILSLEQDLSEYKRRCTNSEEKYRRTLVAAESLQEEHDDIVKRHSRMVNYTMQFVVPVIILILTLVIFYGWNLK